MSAARIKWFCLLAVVSLLGVASVAQSYLAETQVLVRAASIDLDAREDEPGIQYEASTLKNIPLRLVVVSPLDDSSLRVSAQLQGPGMSEPQEVVGVLGGYLELPPLVVPGSYQLSAVKVLSASGNVLTQRDPRLPAIELTVLDELLVTSVTSRPLDTDEINDKGIVIDEDNFTVLNFAVGMVVDSEEVSIDLPVALPRQTNEISGAGSGGGGAPIILDKSDLDFLNIPNLSVSGFTLSRPEESASEDDFSAPISGLMIIPGNIAYLNQFFSVLLAATNIAGEQSGIVLEDPQATIMLPTGDDGILSGDGDDPLRMAELDGGQPQTLPLLGDHADGIHPQSTHQAEYLVEGLREGTHVVEFDLSGTLSIPGAPEGLPLEGVARGIVQVRNPTFTLNLSHPDVVRVDEPYRLYASVTNTSNAPANLFTLSLDPLGLMGARLADGETSSRSLETLAAGETREFVFELVALINGEVTATVFLADPGINGAFLLRTGVGDTGIQ
ncbi:MAG: hypothetical protein HOI23_08020, partial [Deltaproteobacteria bacterium]|nr:hypothetical protein [Deltaproteobacteria bacterium]